MHYFSTSFGKELYMFQKDLLSIIRSHNCVLTAIGICHTEIIYDDDPLEWKCVATIKDHSCVSSFY